MDDLIITNHAEKRFKARSGLPKRLVTKTAQLALANGVTHAETTGRLRKYFDKLYLAQESANNIRAYCGMVYIFYYSKLLTVFPLPTSLRKQAAKIQARKKRGRDGTE